MTLRQFAYLVSGPRDFVINVAINMGVAWWLYRHEATTPWMGEPSIASMLGPMCLFLTAGTTFFGFLNGALQRKKAAVIPPLDRDVRWIRRAAVTGAVYGLIALAVSTALVWAIDAWHPGIELPRRTAVTGIGLLAGCLAYVLHSHAVMQTAKLE